MGHLGLKSRACGQKMAYLHNTYLAYVHKVRVDEQNTLLLYYCITVTVLLYGCIIVLLYYALEFDVQGPART